VNFTYGSTGDYTSAAPWGFVWYILFVIGLWGMLRKAGLPGWGAIIPIYNLYLLIKLGGLSGFTMILAIIPIVNIGFAFYLAGKVSYAFGSGVLMAIFGLVLFSPIGYLMLGLDRSRYLLPGFDRAVGDNRA
jgi:hypothetical protein